MRTSIAKLLGGITLTSIVGTIFSWFLGNSLWDWKTNYCLAHKISGADMTPWMITIVIPWGAAAFCVWGAYWIGSNEVKRATKKAAALSFFKGRDSLRLENEVAKPVEPQYGLAEGVVDAAKMKKDQKKAALDKIKANAFITLTRDKGGRGNALASIYQALNFEPADKNISQITSGDNVQESNQVDISREYNFKFHNPILERYRAVIKTKLVGNDNSHAPQVLSRETYRPTDCDIKFTWHPAYDQKVYISFEEY
jgi:hypothetical protein